MKRLHLKKAWHLNILTRPLLDYNDRMLSLIVSYENSKHSATNPRVALADHNLNTSNRSQAPLRSHHRLNCESAGAVSTTVPAGGARYWRHHDGRFIIYCWYVPHSFLLLGIVVFVQNSDPRILL